MAAVDVLRALVMLRVIGQVDGAFVVHGQRCWFGLWKAQLSEESPEIDCLFGGLRRRDDLSFA
eukprot:3975053-Pleurochrysis_carterae.AAC.1